MIKSLRTLDRVLRGEVTRPESLAEGHIELPVGGLMCLILCLGMIYGACMGSYSLFKEIDPSVTANSDRYWQVLASTLKVPALFLLTLLVTFPSLYVFNALVGSRLNFQSVGRLLIAALAVNLAVLASLGPIVAFFSVSTTSYAFMKLFNVVVFAIAGGLGLSFLVQTLNRMSQPTRDMAASSVEPEGRETRGEEEESIGKQSGEENSSDEADSTVSSPSGSQPIVDPNDDLNVGALDPVEGHMVTSHVQTVFRIWMAVFGLVGAQMGWVLRPFLGNPAQPFTWFRQRESSIFEELIRSLGQLFSGG